MAREYLPEEYTKEDRDLIKVFQQTMNELELAYLKAIHSNDTIKANAFLKQIKGVAKTLNDEYSDRADIRITEEYLKGVKYLDEAGEIEDTIGFVDFSKGKAKEMIGELGPAHVQAVNALLNTSKNYVKSSLDGLERQTMSLIGELQQQRVREELAKGILKGESRFEVNKKVTKYFEEQNLGFKDRAGRVWTMDRYVDMLTRTETAIANVQGTINRGIQVGLTKFRVIEHFDCCGNICSHYNGEVFDVSKGMVNLPPYHPNCRGYIETVIDGHDYKEKESFNKKTSTIDEVIGSVGTGKEKVYVIEGGITKDIGAMLTSLGHNKEEYKSVIDTGGVEHILKRHGGTHELKRDQRTVTPDDIKKIPDIVKYHDSLEYRGKSKNHYDVLATKKDINGDVYNYRMRINTNDKEIQPQSLFIKKKRT